MTILPLGDYRYAQTIEFSNALIEGAYVSKVRMPRDSVRCEWTPSIGSRRAQRRKEHEGFSGQTLHTDGSCELGQIPLI